MSKSKLDPQAVKLHTLGNKLVREQKYNEAISNFEKAVQIEPEYAIAYQHLAEAYEAKKLDDKAFECYLKAIDLNESLAMQHIESGLYNLLAGPLGKAVLEFKKKKEGSGEIAEDAHSEIAAPREGSPVDLASRPAVEKPRGQKGLKPVKVIVHPADERISSDVWSVDHVTATVLGDKEIPVIDAMVVFRIVDEEDMMDSFIAILEEKANLETGPRKLKLKTDSEGRVKIFFRRSKKKGLNRISIEVEGTAPVLFEDYTKPLKVYSADITPQENFYRTAQDVEFSVSVFDYFWNPVEGADVALYLQEQRKDNGEWDVIDNANYKADETGLITHTFTMPTRGHLRCRMMVENKAAEFTESVEFNVAPGNASGVLFIPGGGEVAAGGDFTLKMRLMDEFDNPIDGIPADIVLVESSGEWIMGGQSSPITERDGSVIVKITAPPEEGCSAVFSINSDSVANPAAFRASFETVSADSPEVQKQKSPFGDEFDGEFDDSEATADIYAEGAAPAIEKEPVYQTSDSEDLSGLPDVDTSAPAYGDEYSEEHSDDSFLLEPQKTGALDSLDIPIDESADYAYEPEETPEVDKFEDADRFGDVPDADSSFLVVESGSAKISDDSSDDAYDDFSETGDRFGDISGADSDEFLIAKPEDDAADEALMSGDFSSGEADRYGEIPDVIPSEEDTYEEPADVVSYETDDIYVPQDAAPEEIYEEPIPAPAFSRGAGESYILKLAETEIACRPGETVPIKAICRFSDGAPASSGVSLYFEIVESIGPGADSQLTDANGMFLGKTYEVEPDMSGEAVVNVSASEKCGSFTVRISAGESVVNFIVNIAPGEPEAIRVEADDYCPAPGSSVGIKAVVMDSFGNPVPGEFVAVTIEEHSGDPGSFDGETSGATDDNGEVYIYWTAPAAAGATVKISASNPSVASFAVTPAEISVSGAGAATDYAPQQEDEYSYDDAYSDNYQESGDAYGDIAAAPIAPPRPPVTEPVYAEPEQSYEEEYQEETYTDDSGEGAYMEQDYAQTSSEYDSGYDEQGYAEAPAPPPPPQFMEQADEGAPIEADEPEYYVEEDNSDPYATPHFEFATGRKTNPAMGKFMKKVITLSIVGVLLLPVGYYGSVGFKYMRYQFYISKARTAVLNSTPGKQINAEAMMFYEKAHDLDPQQIYPMAKLAQIHIMNMEKLKVSNNIKNLEMESKKAEMLLKQILTIEPNNYDAIYDLGKLYELNEEFCKAQDQYIKALSIDKSYEAAEAKKSEMRAKCNMQQKMKTGRYSGQ